MRSLAVADTGASFPGQTTSVTPPPPVASFPAASGTQGRNQHQLHLVPCKPTPECSFPKLARIPLESSRLKRTRTQDPCTALVPKRGNGKQRASVYPLPAPPLQAARNTAFGYRYRRVDEKSIVILSSLGMCWRHLTPDRSKSLRDAFMLVVSRYWVCMDVVCSVMRGGRFRRGRCVGQGWPGARRCRKGFHPQRTLNVGAAGSSHRRPGGYSRASGVTNYLVLAREY